MSGPQAASVLTGVNKDDQSCQHFPRLTTTAAQFACKHGRLTGETVTTSCSTTKSGSRRGGGIRHREQRCQPATGPGRGRGHGKYLRPIRVPASIRHSQQGGLCKPYSEVFFCTRQYLSALCYRGEASGDEGKVRQETRRITAREHGPCALREARRSKEGT